MSDKPDPILQQKEQQQLKTQLLWRLGIAGTLIAGVLGAIAWFDRDKASPEVQIPQIAPVVSVAPIASAIAPIAASEVASAPEAVPTVSAAPSPAATTAPNQTQTEAISNVPKRTTEISSAKKPITMPVTTPLPKPTLPLAPATPQSMPAPASNFPIASSSHLGFSVQAGVFLHSSNAEKLLAQIQAAGIPAYLETRVQIGPFKTKAEANAAVKKLRKLGIEPIIKTE
ncbi:SPOR domain-containing protein [Deefgea rivuli]|uniref:SPOR domain-containing protein n=1 Tax=Deefgea rivuli TaxID=400948 RepID=UPI0004899E1A|nr:SPOR domain-containing protein [Deefgea rivuli]